MTRFSRFLRNLIERLILKYYEGPVPPRRLFEEVRVFRHFKPLAEAHEWERFAVELAQKAYRDGFVRGNEWLERSWEGPAISPERLAEQASHDWSLAEQDARWAAILKRAGDPMTARQAAEARDTLNQLRKAAMQLTRAPEPRRR